MGLDGKGYIRMEWDKRGGKRDTEERNEEGWDGWEMREVNETVREGEFTCSHYSG